MLFWVNGQSVDDWRDSAKVDAPVVGMKLVPRSGLERVPSGKIHGDTEVRNETG